ncbi:hypothetical protein NDU88_002999 [Pleurodeles waltl]|uniref:Uncharacterized protein n=1 Tax=Pleurodeles waltl TaxID=8319 RepID=A0AAV7V0Z0_PLEWA|nr:hypothetical protein NDU88_002999 [Pleurodeles waltl]
MPRPRMHCLYFWVLHKNDVMGLALKSQPQSASMSLALAHQPDQNLSDHRKTPTFFLFVFCVSLFLQVRQDERGGMSPAEPTQAVLHTSRGAVRVRAELT